MDKESFKGFYTEYGYRGAEELSKAWNRIKELEDQIEELKEKLQEEKDIRDAIVR